jgi:hypothetical protein
MSSSDPISFHAVTLEDRAVVESYYDTIPYLSCDYSFSNLIGWAHLYRTELAQHKGYLIIRFWNEQFTRHAYLMPVGPDDPALLRDVLEDMEKDQDALEGKDLTIMGATPEAVRRIDAAEPDQMTDLPDRDYAEYIYLREKLATLSGKKLQSKRNHCNRFERLYPDWRYEPITKDSIEECLAVEEQWYRDSDPAEGADEERRMIDFALTHMTEIGMTGGLIRVEGKVVAFTLGMPQSARCFDINVEKADVAYDGAFTMINREFARRIPEQYTYVNREEDMGLPGLRRAKLSYKPEILLEEHTVMMIL